jgi:hypothetical protein
MAAWLFIRIAVISLVTFSIIEAPVELSNLDWAAAMLIGAVVGLGIFAWLAMIRENQDVEWSGAFDLLRPFWPMTRYPLQYWFLISFGLIIGGAAGVTKQLATHSGREAVPGTFLIMGLSIFTSLRLFQRSRLI